MKKVLIKSLFLVLSFTGVQSIYAQKKSNWVAPASASELKNPVGTSPAILKDAKSVYSTTCSPCHGEKGRGDGPASAALVPKPANHSSAMVQSQTDGAIYWKLTEGKSPMPSYKTLLTDNQRWGLVAYIRTLKK